MTTTDASEQAEQAAPPPTGGPALQAEVAERSAALREDAKRLGEEAARLKKDGIARAAAAKALGPLAKPAVWRDAKRLGAAVARAEQRLGSESSAQAGLEDLLQRLREYAANAPMHIRRELGRALQEACRERGLGFHVIAKDDTVEVRIPPLSVVIDFAKSRAELRFARETVAKSAASADAILAAHAKALAVLDGAFDPGEFFGRCRKAYLHALSDRSGRDGDRIEILDFLPYLALQHQSKRFRANPTAANYRSYGKAQFAFDVLRLGKAGALASGGQRLNLGVATGTTASDKSRVVYLENELGQGEHKLTIYFTPAEGGAAS